MNYTRQQAPLRQALILTMALMTFTKFMVMKQVLQPLTEQKDFTHQGPECQAMNFHK